jgi:hypothetical protein
VGESLALETHSSLVFPIGAAAFQASLESKIALGDSKRSLLDPWNSGDEFIQANVLAF